MNLSVRTSVDYSMDASHSMIPNVDKIKEVKQGEGMGRHPLSVPGFCWAGKMAFGTYQPSAVRPRDQDDPHDDAHPEGENSAKRQKTFKHGTFVFRESSSGQDYESKPGPSTSGNQEQLDDFDVWTDSYTIDDNVIPTEKVSQELVDEMSQFVDEAKLRKVVDEILRQRCTSGDEHQYHIDQMQNFLKNDIVWESRKEIIVAPYP
ncbi:hypothetical protein Tco_0877863 [Tanacetum coccineum]|uniref:Uncharacterized protein n=1 Tax=Tanacetum coccineum TaxID=301880 RepID=A0ABQ5BZ98_9ASTR